MKSESKGAASVRIFEATRRLKSDPLSCYILSQGRTEDRLARFDLGVKLGQLSQLNCIKEIRESKTGVYLGQNRGWPVSLFFGIQRHIRTLSVQYRWNVQDEILTFEVPMGSATTGLYGFFTVIQVD